MIKKFFTKSISPASGFGLQKLAFSLAEILVVIGIVGMVADLTVPELVSNYQDQSTIIKLRRAYAMASGAYNLAVAENGTPDGWNIGEQGDAVGLTNMNSIMTQSLKVIKNCGTGSGCFPESNYKALKGTTATSAIDTDPTYTKMILPDGTSMALTQLDPDCNANWGTTQALSNVCGFIGIDINGFKAPNMYGEDYFGFVLTKYGVVPMGTNAQTEYPFNGFCNNNSNAVTNNSTGLSCTAWVLYNENLDYVDCNNLNWSGRTSCDPNQVNNGGTSNGGGSNGGGGKKA